MFILTKIELLIKDALIEKGWKESEAINTLKTLKEKENVNKIDYLVENNTFKADEILSILLNGTEFEQVELNTSIIDKEMNQKWISLCKSHMIIFLKGEQNGKTVVAVSDPSKKDMIEDLNYHLQGNYEIVLSKVTAIKKHLNAFHNLYSGTFNDNKEKSILDKDSEFEYVELSDDDSVVFDEHENVLAVNSILSDAINKGVSDIHFEPKEKFFKIRYRIDGKMHNIDVKDKEEMSGIISRIKVISGMDITNKRKPQEGRFTTNFQNRAKMDFRVSIIPMIWGEKMVIRVLDNLYSNIGIEKIGMTESQRLIYQDALSKKQGMILVTGPTGAGKSITLFSGIAELPCDEINVITAESPVEVQMENINQINVADKKGLTYPEVLRYVLRQDPDVIMIGEIRDTETLEISFKAAQTGHLVLSTLHAKDPFQTFERLETMSESLFNIVNSINVICSQRLFRKLCKNCRIPKQVSVGLEKEMEKQGINLKAGDTCYQANEHGCDECHDGHSGRTALFEVLKMDDEIKEMLLKREPSSKVKKYAKAQGYQEMREVALERLKNGEISLEEFFANI